MGSAPYKLFSFFSGAGFLDLGFETEGYSIVFANDICEPFLNAYVYARENMGGLDPDLMIDHGDIRDCLEDKKAANLRSMIEEAKKTSIVGFIGGPPCPDFSVGGKNKGKTGEHGILSDVYVDLIIKMRPHFFVFENVKGLWRTQKHRAYYEELKAKLAAGNFALSERLINAIEYGAPQDRERIILIGFDSDFLKSRNIELPASGSLLSGFPWARHTAYRRETVFRAAWPKRDKFREEGKAKRPRTIIKELTVQHWFEKNEVGKHPNRLDFFQARSGLPKMLSIDEGDDSKKSFKRLHRWRYSPTACYGNNEVHLHPFYPRRISVAEALALQSLPKHFTLPPEESLTNKFKMIGNGVPFLAARGIAKTIRSFLNTAPAALNNP